MKTKQIPVLLALAAGLITCIISFLNQAGTGRFVRNLCLAVVIFYILGCVVKLILDKSFPIETETEEEPEETEQQAASEEIEQQAEEEVEEIMKEMMDEEQ